MQLGNFGVICLQADRRVDQTITLELLIYVIKNEPKKNRIETYLDTKRNKSFHSNLYGMKNVKHTNTPRRKNA